MTRWVSASFATVERVRPVVLLTLGMAIVALILVGIAVAVVNSDAAMPEAPRDLADVGLPDGRAMTPDDVAELRFSMGLRGYRMGEVDDALTRLREELADRDAEIAQLRKQRYADAGPDEIVAIVDPARDVEADDAGAPGSPPDEEADDAVSPAATPDGTDREELPLATPGEQVGELAGEQVGEPIGKQVGERLRETHG